MDQTNAPPGLAILRLRNKTAPLMAKSLTIRILNLCLAKYHFVTRSNSLGSQLRASIYHAHSTARRFWEWKTRF
jgi:hypothetical protein